MAVASEAPDQTAEVLRRSFIEDRVDHEHGLSLGEELFVRVRHASEVPQRVQRVQNGGHGLDHLADVLAARAEVGERGMPFP